MSSCTLTLPSNCISYSISWENVIIYQLLLVLTVNIQTNSPYCYLYSSYSTSWENLMTYQASRHQNTISHNL